MKFKPALFLLLALTACGPVIKTVYEYVPPKDAGGQRCIIQCLSIKGSCKTDCSMEQAMCVDQTSDQDDIDYENYVSQRSDQGKLIKKSRTNFDSTGTCQFPGDDCKKACDADYNSCFAGCGGVVKEHEVCTALCDKLPPGSNVEIKYEHF